MVRRRRDLESSRFFHLTNRGNDRQDIFSVDADWHVFESGLGEMCARHGVVVLAYAWMTNHFHLVVECADVEQLPDMMRDFQAGYARGYNLRTDRTGSLFERAFFSRPVMDDLDLLRTARYVHLNPVDIVGERALPSYRWSSLGVYLGRRRAPSWMRTGRLDGLIRPDRYMAELAGPSRWDRLPLGRCEPRIRTRLSDIARVVDALPASVPQGLRCELLCHLALTTHAASDLEIGSLQQVDRSTIRRRARRARVKASTDVSVARLVERVLDQVARLPRERTNDPGAFVRPDE